MGGSSRRSRLYNRRLELVGAAVGTNLYGYAYDTTGNRTWAAANAVTNAYTANALNQYTSISTPCGSAPLRETAPTYDADGNLVSDGVFSYVYDAENRLVSACPLSPTEGSLAVENAYDHRHRRVRKTVRRYDGSAWQMAETHTFVWDGMNIVLERIAFADGTARTCEYFWGPDKSDAEQGAGGVGGLLAVSVDGAFHIPCCDHNGNIVCYVSESGAIAAQYVYDPYGNIIEQYGSYADRFAFGFSTKYHDRETGMVAYQRRFYRPDLGRWLNRDPIEEEGGLNLYGFVYNNPTQFTDFTGLTVIYDADYFPGADDIGGSWRLEIEDDTDVSMRLRRQNREALEMVMRRAAIDICIRLKFANKWYEKYLDEMSFDTAYQANWDKYFLIEGEDSVWRGNEVNYVGIGMFEAARNASRNAILVYAWKAVHLHWPSKGTLFWYRYGYDSYPRFAKDIDPCTCKVKK